MRRGTAKAAGLSGGMVTLRPAAAGLVCSTLRLNMMASMRSWSPNTELSDVPACDRGVGTAPGVGRNSKGSRLGAAAGSCFRGLARSEVALGAAAPASGHEDMEIVDDAEVERLYTGGNMAESTGESGEQRRGSNMLGREALVGYECSLREQSVGQWVICRAERSMDLEMAP
ncbi:unnamed protein product [Phytophthora lilii]|uniref:Unnamed protein product n=1 Tax=Phytophthora lilii TaxID=2077276 RepID=A0A9W6UAZ9_9STRA|nr:unnamed protein product [Phytophthora lilii]